MKSLTQPHVNPALANSFLDTPCEKIPGVGKKTLDRLAQMHIFNLHDMLWHLPRAYEDRRTIAPIAELTQEIGNKRLVEVSIIKTQHIKGGTERFIVQTEDETASQVLEIIFFRPHPQMMNQWRQGRKLRAFGEVGLFQNALQEQTLQMVHPDTQFIDKGPIELPTHLTPIYPSSQGIHQKHWRKWFDWIFDQCHKAPIALDLVPQTLQIDQFGTHINLIDALEQVHHGEHLLDRNHPAYQRLIIEEIIAHSLLWTRQTKPHPAESVPYQDLHKILSAMPYQLTASQKTCVDQILYDLNQPEHMVRLLQGDVGSGKTLVAAIVAAATAQAGLQVALMSPTEVLTQQHYASICQLLAPLNIKCVMLTGQMPKSQRNNVLASIAQGEAQIIIGTHALFQKDVSYNNLRFIIIDEQHRFGVEQRLALIQKGQDGHNRPHQLLMTATPIPRTLTMSLYSKLKTSTINELPPGRQPITTSAVSQLKRQSLIERVAEFIKKGQQVFWVCPHINASQADSESTQLQDSQMPNTAKQCQQTVINVFNELQEQARLKSIQAIHIEMLHGQLAKSSREQILQNFASGSCQLLVATSMIEVGVNIPNANVMIVEHAQNWGLSQLHQLRGRVGRGNLPGFMILLYDDPLSEEGYQRLKILREHSDGFVIAEKDLELRGPGQVTGLQQSGQNDLKILQPSFDKALFSQIQPLVDQLDAQYSQLASYLLKRWFGNYQTEMS